MEVSFTWWGRCISPIFLHLLSAQVLFGELLHRLTPLLTVKNNNYVAAEERQWINLAFSMQLPCYTNPEQKLNWQISQSELLNAALCFGIRASIDLWAGAGHSGCNKDTGKVIYRASDLYLALCKDAHYSYHSFALCLNNLGPVTEFWLVSRRR